MSHQHRRTSDPVPRARPQVTARHRDERVSRTRSLPGDPGSRWSSPPRHRRRAAADRRRDRSGQCRHRCDLEPAAECESSGVLGHQHRQRLLRRAAVLGRHLGGLRRPRLRPPGRPRHPGAADPYRREGARRAGLGRVAGLLQGAGPDPGRRGRAVPPGRHEIYVVERGDTLSTIARRARRRRRLARRSTTSTASASDPTRTGWRSGWKLRLPLDAPAAPV